MLYIALMTDIIKDAMDPQFLANLQRLGPVAVNGPAAMMRSVSLLCS
jgi:hypothetical protein